MDLGSIAMLAMMLAMGFLRRDPQWGARVIVSRVGTQDFNTSVLY